MPREDGTGPAGAGAGTGRGQGRGIGRGQGQGQGLGRQGGLGLGIGGFCVCPGCGKRVPHERGMPCTQRQCPDCKIALTREG